MDRYEKMLNGIDLATAKALEIGACDKPTVSPASPGVFYVDHLDTAGLREKYHNDASVDIDKLVHVHGVWGAQTLQQITAGAAPFDYVVASHVIEHVPDLITWLRELSSVLTADGQVRLAIPDRRHCFDFPRKDTVSTDVVNAWLMKARYPQPREVLDFTLHRAEVDLLESWAEGFNDSSLRRKFTAEQAIELARDVLANRVYHDVHCWVFTPTSFARLLASLARAGLVDFGCAGYFDTPRFDHEFFVSLGKMDDRDQAVASWEAMHHAVGGADASGCSGAVAAEPTATETAAAEIAALRTRLGEAETLAAQIEARAGEVGARAQQLAERVAALESSTSWRVTAPLRALKRGKLRNQ